MGAATSKRDGVAFAARSEYHKWTLGDVQAAVERWLNVSRKAAKVSGCGVFQKFGVNKREFWEIFTDYTVLRGGAFLCLPVKHFSVFDPHNTNSVFVLEVFVLMLLFCNAPMREKIRAIFHLIDFNATGFITQPDMMMLMRAVLVGASRVGITKSQPDGKETRELAHMAFDGADVNSDEQVTLGEFEPWAQGQIESQRLWLKFGFQPAREDVGLKAISSNNTRAVLRSRMPHDRRSSLQARMAHTKVEQSKELVKEKGDSHVPASLLANKDFLEVKRLDTKARARKLITIATRKTLSDVVKKTSFSLVELQALLANFVDASDVTGRLDRPTFHTVLMKHAPGLTEDGIIDRVHEVVDMDKDGFINFQELCFGLSTVMRGSLNDKLTMLFDIYDYNGDHEISIVELVSLIRKNDADFMQMIEFAEEVVASLDKNGDDEISREEFAEALSRDPVVMDIFAQCTSVPRDKARSCHELLQKEEGHTLSLQTLHDYVESLGTARGRMLVPIPLEEFREFMYVNFGFGEGAQRRLDTVHSQFDMNDNGLATMRDIITAFGQVLTDTIEDRASFFFEVYDLDGSGSLDRNEIMHMLLTASESSNAHAKDVLSMLSKLDKDCDGHVSLEEFQERASRQPLLMETLERMFMVRGDISNVLAPANARHRRSLQLAVAAATNVSRQAVKNPAAAAARTKRRRSRMRRQSLNATLPSPEEIAAAAAAKKHQSSAATLPPASSVKVRALSGGGSAAGAGAGAGAGSGTSSMPTLPSIAKPQVQRRRVKGRGRGRRKSTTIDGGAMGDLL